MPRWWTAHAATSHGLLTAMIRQLVHSTVPAGDFDARKV